MDGSKPTSKRAKSKAVDTITQDDVATPADVAAVPPADSEKKPRKPKSTDGTADSKKSNANDAKKNDVAGDAPKPTKPKKAAKAADGADGDTSKPTKPKKAKTDSAAEPGSAPTSQPKPKKATKLPDAQPVAADESTRRLPLSVKALPADPANPSNVWCGVCSKSLAKSRESSHLETEAHKQNVNRMVSATIHAH